MGFGVWGLGFGLGPGDTVFPPCVQDFPQPAACEEGDCLVRDGEVRGVTGRGGGAGGHVLGQAVSCFVQRDAYVRGDPIDDHPGAPASKGRDDLSGSGGDGPAGEVAERLAAP